LNEYPCGIRSNGAEKMHFDAARLKAMIAGETSVVTPTATPAELVLTNGTIYTVDANQPWAEAMAIAGSRIIYVGTAANVTAYISPATKIIDLEGKFLMPGLVDTHVHAVLGGAKMIYECNFPFTATPDDISHAVAKSVEGKPEGAWIRGGQWDSDFFRRYRLDSPRAFLDRVSGTHPVVLADDALHNIWANTSALEAAGFVAGSADPAGGKLERDADGTPNGILLEAAADIMWRTIPDWTVEQYVAATIESVRIANSYGITSIKEANATPAILQAFNTVDAQGALTLHAALCLQGSTGSRNTPIDYTSLIAMRDKGRSRHVHTEFVKIFLDGVPTPARTAAMISPYVADAQHGSDFAGNLHVAPNLLARDLVELDRRGFTVKIHAAGDRAVRVALDAVEAARRVNGSSGLHHEIAHAGYIDPQDIPRFATLDVIPDFSPILWHPSPIIAAVLSAVGSERGLLYWPTKTLLASGALVASGSDWPSAVPDQNPWIGIEALVTRQDPRGKTPGALWEAEAIGLDDALRIYTLNGARALRIDTETGSITTGKFADFIILDRDLFKVPVTEVGDTQVLETWFEGQRIY